MASVQARLMSFVLRHTFKPRLARAPDAVAARVAMRGPVAKTPPGVRITPDVVGGVNGEWVEAEAARRLGGPVVPARRGILRVLSEDAPCDYDRFRPGRLPSVRARLSSRSRASVSGSLDGCGLRLP